MEYLNKIKIFLFRFSLIITIKGYVSMILNTLQYKHVFLLLQQGKQQD